MLKLFLKWPLKFLFRHGPLNKKNSRNWNYAISFLVILARELILNTIITLIWCNVYILSYIFCLLLYTLCPIFCLIRILNLLFKIKKEYLHSMIFKGTEGDNQNWNVFLFCKVLSIETKIVHSRNKLTHLIYSTFVVS